MNQPLVEMFHYNRWANRQLFEACRSLTDDQLHTHVAGTSGPVAEILVHIVGGQQTLVLRTFGRQNANELGRSSDWPGIQSLVEVLAASDDELIAIAEAIDADEQVNLPYRGTDRWFPRRFFLLHALQHGVEHRTEVKIALGNLGVGTPDLDGWFYAAARGYGSPDPLPS